MDHNSLFAFIPQLRPFQIIPSEDDPKEFILFLEENGASLGINHTERRLIESFDGRMAVGDIVLRITKDSSAKMTEVRRLLWDLDRYGFLETSPWQEYSKSEAWGYWGTKDQPLTRIYYSSIFGTLERWSVKQLLHPLPMVVVFFLCVCIYAGSFFISSDELPAIWSVTRLLIINQSVALGILVVLLGIIAALFVSTWVSASVVSAVHESPAGIAVFWQSPFLRFMVDGRRLRMLPLHKMICAGLFPTLKLMSIAMVLSVAGAWSDGVRREWLLHLSLAFMITAFGTVLPWFSTLLSRDMVLRLRSDSVFWTTWRSVQKAFQNLFHSNQDAALHEKLFTGWGLWAVISLVIVVRFAATLFRADFPVLYSYFLQENNAVLLGIFLVVSTVMILGIFTALLTFFVWLIRLLVNEIQLKAFPERYKDIAVLIPIIYLFTGMLCIFYNNHQSSLFVNCVTLFAGLSIAWIGVRLFQHEHTGLDFYTHGMVIINGCAIFIFALEKQYLFLPFSDRIIITLPLLVLIVFSVFNNFRSVYLFNSNKLTFKSLPIIIALIVTAIIHYFYNASGSEIKYANWDIAAIFLAIEFAFMLLIIYQINSIAQLFVISSFSIYFVIEESARENMYPGLFILTVLFALGLTHAYLIVRKGMFSTIALRSKSSTPSIKADWNTVTIRDSLISAVEELCSTSVIFKYRQITNEDQLREMLFHLAKYLGVPSIVTLFRRVSNDLPWEATQKLASLIPPHVSLQNLTGWDEEKVVSYLRNVPTFMHAGDEIKEVSSISRFRFYDKGDRFITQDSTERELMIIIKGKAAVDVEHAYGYTRLTVMSVGDFVGEIGFLSGAPRTASVRALEPVTALSVSCDDINESMPNTLKSILDAESGQSWLQALHQINIFREFSPALLSRVCLESQHVHLELSRTVLMHQEPYANSVAVLLSGEAVFQQDGHNTHMEPGTIAGLVESILCEPVKGVIRAESPSHLLLVDNSLFSSTLIELLTPKQILTIEE